MCPKWRLRLGGLTPTSKCKVALNVNNWCTWMKTRTTGGDVGGRERKVPLVQAFVRRYPAGKEGEGGGRKEEGRGASSQGRAPAPSAIAISHRTEGSR